ncbi:Transcription factor 1 [Exophiala dermatitidis]
MDSPTERMPIACVHCAKAKAKCDKKVPCSRCVSKQIVCQSRATRRSSHNPTRRTPLPRANSERAIHSSASYHVSQLSHFGAATPAVNGLPPNTMSPHAIPPHRLSLPDSNHHVPIAPAIFTQEMEPQLLRSGYTHTPPDMAIPITPMMPAMPQMENFMQIHGTPYDYDGDNHFLAMSGGHPSMIEFDAANLLTDFMSPPPAMMHDPNDQFLMNGKIGLQTPNHIPLNMHVHEGSTPMGLRLDLESPPNQMPYRPPAGLSPSNSSVASGLQEPDAVFAAHHAWPFFQCNVVEKYSFAPPKTAAIYLEGLAQTLRNQATWSAWASQLDESSLDISTERKIATEPIVGWSREKLLAITQGFLHKALDIHKADHQNREETPSSPDSSRDTFLMLPPPDVMQYFLRSYVVRYEPYYSSVPAGRLDPNTLMQSNNSKAASLLILLMVASGASSTATIEARYVASGLTEACRISLFDTIEKDVLQSREVLVLRSALLFASLAAWSGDKWHMDMAMGQRGMYLAMLDHSGMLNAADLRIDIDTCRHDPEMTWEEWKEHEGKHRLTHSWVIVDQEMSLFSDTTPLLSVVNLHTPMPDSDDLWHAESAVEWLELFEKVHGSTYQSPASVRDFFTSFVDGEMAGQELSPTELRLLLHPLQGQVCQLRQFIACLPDGAGNSQGKASRSVSRVATKARLEEISSLLQQWYAISKQSFSGNKGTCWTTCANLIMYHLISLNVITSFKDIEQLARREVALGSFRFASWLQMRCIDQPEEAFFHCGQILRLIRSMPRPVRPPWWAGAVYRVALTGWATSMAGGGARVSPGHAATEPDRQFAIDDLTPENEAIGRYMKYQEGTPMLSRPDGTLAPMDVPSNILQHCIELLEDDSSMRLAEGIKRKLRMFMANWKDN